MSKVIGVICAFMCTFSIAGDLVQRPFIGKFVNYNLQHPENKEVTRVYMSEFGVRVESDGMFGAEAGVTAGLNPQLFAAEYQPKTSLFSEAI